MVSHEKIPYGMCKQGRHRLARISKQFDQSSFFKICNKESWRLKKVKCEDPDQSVLIHRLLKYLHVLKCLSIGTPKTINCPFVPNGKLIVFRYPKIKAL